MNTTFESLARMITVRDISQPFHGRVEASTPVAEVWRSWCDECADRDENPWDQIALAIDKGNVVGWLGLDMLETGKSAGECASSVSPEAILAANTPVIEAARVLATTTLPFFFTLEANSLSGWVAFSHLYKLPFRLCLFSLLLGIEQLAADLIKTKPAASLKALSPGRLQKLKDIIVFASSIWTRTVTNMKRN